LLDRLGIVSVAEVVWKGRLRWYEHVERKDVEDWVSKCRRLVNRGAGVGAGLRRHGSSVKCYIRKCSMQMVEPFDKDKWRSGVGLIVQPVQAWKKRTL